MTHQSQSLKRVDWIRMRNPVFVHNHRPFQSRCRPAYLAAYNTHCYQVADEHWITMVCQCKISYEISYSRCRPAYLTKYKTFHKTGSMEFWCFSTRVKEKHRSVTIKLQEEICPVVVSESQCSFRSGRGCVDMISARQVQEECIEQQVPLYQVFVDLTKAFDTVNRDAFWKVFGKLGCPPTFVHTFRELHRDMKPRVAFNGRLSDEISVDNGVKQGDIPAPTLFSIYFAVLLGVCVLRLWRRCPITV